MDTQRCGKHPIFLVSLFLAFSFLVDATRSLAQVQLPVVDSVDSARHVTLTGNVHPLARAEFDRGPTADSMLMTRILLLLKHSEAQEAALQDYLAQQQDKSSPNYHAWLTPQEFGAEYGPADADVQAVTRWLSSQGFRMGKVYSNKTVIEFSGTSGQVRAAFATSIRNYQVDGTMYVANASDPQIPAALAPVVAGIVSLNNFPRQPQSKTVGHARKIPGKPGLEPLYTFPIPNGTTTLYAIAPGDFATIYNSKGLIGGGNDGTGQSIAIVGETNIALSDVQAYRTMFGLPASFTSANIILNGEDPGITSTGEETEADLDTQLAGAVAPGATVKLVVSASTPASSGVDLSALYIIEHNLADVMSESYGSCESTLGAAGNAFYNSLWEQAAAQGITVVVGSGDNGSAGCDDPNTATSASNGLAVNGLASTPFNVAVGGTDFDEVNNWTAYWSATNATTGTDMIGTSALGYIPEIPWSQNCAQISITECANPPNSNWLNIVAGSGGPSTQYTKPSWQMGVAGMQNDSHRDLPDVALFASPGFDGSGYIVCQADANSGIPCNLNAGAIDFLIVGGTSASAPAFAGVMALVNQYQAAHGGSSRQGNANYYLYALAKRAGASCTSSGTEAAGCIFNDVTHGNSYAVTRFGSSVGTNSVPCMGGTRNCSVTVASQTGVLVDPANPTMEAWTVTPGYDMVTGLGSVNIANLAANWGNVNTVQTTTSLTLTPTTSITHGTAEHVSVNVSVTPSTATGGVSLIAKFSDGTTQGLDQFTLSGGTVSNTTNSLPGGTNYQVYAHYSGDGTNAPSDSAAVTVSVGQESSKTFIVIPTFDSAGNPLSGNASSVIYGSNYSIRMYVTNSSGAASAAGAPTGTCDQVNLLTCPTGTVTLTDNSTLFGTGGGGTGIYNLNNAGYTRDLTPNLTGGMHALLANYSGDNSYLASSGASSISVTPVPTSIGQTFTVTNPVVGTPFYGSIIGYSQAMRGVAPTGTVTFYDGTTQIGSSGPIQGEPAGYQPQFFANATLTVVSGGSRTITAQYSGDANYAPSTTATTVSAVYPTTASITVSPSTINYGSTVMISGVIDTTIAATNAALKPTGTVLVNGSLGGNIMSAVTTTTSADPSGNWQIQVSATATPSGSQAFSLNYSGDTNYAPATGTSNAVMVNIPDFSLGPAAGITVVPLAGQAGSAQITVTPLTQTPSPVTLAMYPGISMSGYTIAITPQTINLNGAPVTATISLTPTVTVPANSIRSQVRHASLIGTGRHVYWPLSAATGLAALFLLAIPSRRRKYRVVLGLTTLCFVLFVLGCGGGSLPSGPGGGGGGGGGGSSGPQSTTITLSTSNAKIARNTPLPITATVTSASGNVITGSVTFYNFGTAFGSGYSVVNGQYAFQGNVGEVGIYQVTASYSGDSNNLSSTTSAPLIQMVTGSIPVTITGNTGIDSHSLPATIGLQ